MKILSMTATFGKLEHETLTLKPGLNIIEAPNEWGKSTWCAFILAMLYGIDTRQQTTKGSLADKEHYAPWSGRPMSGRMDILWQNRAITLERSTKGRIPFGVFSAYETHTGLAVPELTSENCGLTLLGVEKQVFCRCGFIRLTDMPVTQDEALRRRLNALVTTGDDSDAGDLLSARLTKLKNTCRSNSKNGLLPQAQAQHRALEAQLEQLHALCLQKQQLIRRQTELQQYLQKLHTHQAALRYQSADEHRRRLADAQAQESALRTRLETLTAQCASLPSREEAARKLEQLNDLSSRQQALYMELQFQPKPPMPPKAPFYWHEADPDEVEEKLSDDLEMYRLAEETLGKKPSILWIFGLLLIAAGAAAACFLLIPGLLAVAVGLVLTVIGLASRKKLLSRQDELCALVLVLINEYGSKDTADWKILVDSYRTAYDEYSASLREFRREQRSLKERTAQLEEEAQQLCQGYQPEAIAEELKKAVSLWDTLYDCRRQLQQAEGYVRSLMSVAAPVVAPPGKDTLTHSPQDTDALIADTEAKLRHLQQELGRCVGQMDALPDEDTLNARLEESRNRIRQLNTTLAAITLAQETLLSARNELQKRFAPRIAHRAQALFCALTGGRYDRLSLADDLSVRTAAAEEDNLHTVLWRSDGTIDQLYLALRLAVSEALTPEAPLVLDDALVRFDDARLAAAMDVLAQEATQKQLLLFTCQSRESKALSQ